jgi:hypothetical protein
MASAQISKTAPSGRDAAIECVAVVIDYTFHSVNVGPQVWPIVLASPKISSALP